MLEILVSMFKLGMGFVFALMVLIIYLDHHQKKDLVSHLVNGLLLGGVAGEGVYIIKKYVARLEFMDVMEKGLLVLAVFLLISWLMFSFRRSGKTGIWGKTVLLLFGFAVVLEVMQRFMLEIFPKISLVNGIHSEWIGKIAVVVFGFIFLSMMAMGIRKTGKQMPVRMVLPFIWVVYLQLFFIQMVELLQLLFALRIIPLTTWSIDVLAPIVNHKSVFYYLYIFFITLFSVLLFIRVFRDGRLDESFANPAERRKYLAARRRLYRWVSSLGMLVVIFYSASIGNWIVEAKGMEVKLAVPVHAQNGNILIATSDLKEGDLHLFSYTLDDGTEIRFMVVRKKNENFGVALDACEMCGIAGYFQKGERIMCKKCDSVVNMTTIGFHGGCNPIPLQFEQAKNGFLSIPVSELEPLKDIFQ